MLNIILCYLYIKEIYNNSTLYSSMLSDLSLVQSAYCFLNCIKILFHFISFFLIWQDITILPLFKAQSSPTKKAQSYKIVYTE